MLKFTTFDRCQKTYLDKFQDRDIAFRKFKSVSKQLSQFETLGARLVGELCSDCNLCVVDRRDNNAGQIVENTELVGKEQSKINRTRYKTSPQATRRVRCFRVSAKDSPAGINKQEVSY